MIYERCDRVRPSLISLGLTAIITATALASPASAQGSKERKNARTCTSFGTSYGTPAFSDCMLDQQRRRDFKERDTLEKMALTSQLAKDGQIMAHRQWRNVALVEYVRADPA